MNEMANNLPPPGESPADYSPPVSQLLTLGDPRALRTWLDYLALGLTLDHVPDLIRMALDEDLHWADSESDEVWAPLHAWRALAQLRAEAAVEPLVGLLERVDELDDDWTKEELPQVFGYIGQAAIAPLAQFLADPEQDLWARVAAAYAFAEIGQRHPTLRDQCVSRLTQQLEQHAQQDLILNGFLISYLTDLQAVEATPVMERAFAADRVDISIQGDWEDTQIKLGLLQERLTPKPNYFLMSPVTRDLEKMIEDRLRVQQRNELKARTKSKTKAKAKRKQQKQARKKQRKRK
jgi:hypothetical protein